mmetsp:Transcript_73323/g.122457  ORF Transcript_73323/g.122457 Transcript_73323/m.122457 type:complete len:90 (+) Transcript_73323:787-1056(+)
MRKPKKLIAMPMQKQPTHPCTRCRNVRLGHIVSEPGTPAAAPNLLLIELEQPAESSVAAFIGRVNACIAVTFIESKEDVGFTFCSRPMA